jgi:hypothetical protein
MEDVKRYSRRQIKNERSKQERVKKRSKIGEVIERDSSRVIE